MGAVGIGVLKKGSGTVSLDRNMDLQSGVTWVRTILLGSCALFLFTSLLPSFHATFGPSLPTWIFYSPISPPKYSSLTL